LLPSGGASGTFSINPVTGTLTWCNPQYNGDYNIRIKITEWRKDEDGNPFLVGYVIRDTQFNMSNCTRINEEKDFEKNITIFPNPTNNFTTIQLSSKEKYSFQLYDMAGKLLSHQNCSNTSSYILNLENFTEGIYFLKIASNDNSTITKKIIKQ